MARLILLGGPPGVGNVVSVMRGYFQAGCETGILSWVFARALREFTHGPAMDSA